MISNKYTGVSLGFLKNDVYLKFVRYKLFMVSAKVNGLKHFIFKSWSQVLG